MNTSSFFKIDPNNEDIVSICGKPPDWFKGREYKKLAPQYWFFKKYKEDGDEDAYTKSYKEEILDKLDPKETYNDLGKNAILCCWEPYNKFCHRHLVAKWLMKSLNIKIREI